MNLDDIKVPRDSSAGAASHT